MSLISKLFGDVGEFLRATCQWRIAAASFVFLTTINALFWCCAFYVDQFYQFSFMFGICVMLFITHVVYPLATCGAMFSEKMTSLNEWHENNNRKPFRLRVLHLLAFPFALIFVPFVRCVLFIIYSNFAEYVVMISSGIAAWFLYQNKREQACWAAYLMVLFILTVPPWRFNRVTEQAEQWVCYRWTTSCNAVRTNLVTPCKDKLHYWLVTLQYYLFGHWIPNVVAAVKEFSRACKVWLYDNLVGPVVNFVYNVLYCLEYVIFGHWIPPLTNYVTNRARTFKNWFLATFVQPTARFLDATKTILIYYLCGHWIPPLVESVKRRWSVFCEAFNRKVVDPITRGYIAVKNFLTYWLLGYWIPPFVQKCRQFVDNCKTKFNEFVVQPIVDFFGDFTNNMIYILTGGWIPKFLTFLDTKIITPTVEFYFQLKLWTLYIFTGQFVPDLLQYARLTSIRLQTFIKERYVEPLLSWIHKTVVELKNASIDLAVRTKARLIKFLLDTKFRIHEFKRQMIVRLKTNWAQFKSYLYYQHWLPFKCKTRRFLLKTKLYIKYKIFLPFIKNLILGTIYTLEFACVSVFIPLCEVFVQQCNNLIQLFLDHYGYRAWDWFVDQLPEKSTFVDDSDTELKDFLPNVQETESEEENDDDDDEQEAAYARRDDRNAADDSAFASTDDEAEFSRNLKIPAFENLDSDEEQELALAPEQLVNSGNNDNFDYLDTGRTSASKSSRRKVKPKKTRETKTAMEYFPGFSSDFGGLLSNAAKFALSKTPFFTGLTAGNEPTVSTLEPDFEFLDDRD